MKTSQSQATAGPAKKFAGKSGVPPVRDLHTNQAFPDIFEESHGNRFLAPSPLVTTVGRIMQMPVAHQWGAFGHFVFCLYAPSIGVSADCIE